MSRILFRKSWIIFLTTGLIQTIGLTQICHHSIADDLTEIDPEHLERDDGQVQKQGGMIPTNSNRLAVRGGKSLGANQRYRVSVDLFKPLAVGDKPHYAWDGIFKFHSEYATENFSWDPGLRLTLDFEPKGSFGEVKDWTIKRREIEASVLTAYRRRLPEKKGVNPSRSPKKADVLKIEQDFTQKTTDAQNALAQSKAEIATYEKALTPELLLQFADCQKQLSKDQCMKNASFGVLAILEQKRAEVLELEKKLKEYPQQKADALKTLNEAAQSTFNRITAYSLGTLAVIHEVDETLGLETKVAVTAHVFKFGYHKAVLYGGIANVDYCVVLAPAGLVTGIHKNATQTQDDAGAAVFYKLSAEACLGIRVGNWFEVKDRVTYELRERLDSGESYRSVVNQISLGGVFSLPVEVGYRTEYRSQKPVGKGVTDQLSHFLMFGLTN